MALTITRILITLFSSSLGGFLGHTYADQIKTYLNLTMSDFSLVSTFLGVVIFGIIGIVISAPLFRFGLRCAKTVEKSLARIPFAELLGGTVGLILGLLIAFLLAMPIGSIPLIGEYVVLVLYAFLGYIGMNLGRRFKDRWDRLFDGIINRGVKTEKNKEKNEKVKVKTVSRPKVLDTSAIIDGRIVDIAKSGFLDGPLIVASYVLDELRHIADSGDSVKRVRGRRGLDILNLLQELDEEVIISSRDFPEIEEVDAKLVVLAKEMGGAVVTNDYNLNKVAKFQNVRVLNVNELASAIKTVVVPGDLLTVEIVAEGKENEQGVGYLDDGTMIVVEHGKDKIGETIETVVTSMIQTNAGRMIFVKMI